MEQAAQRIAHLHRLGAQLGRLATGQEVGIQPLDLSRLASRPGALQTGRQRCFEAADGVLQQPGDPLLASRLIVYQTCLDRPLEALRVRVGANREGRAGELQEARQGKIHLNSWIFAGERCAPCPGSCAASGEAAIASRDGR